jgi:hypothetical protein
MYLTPNTSTESHSVTSPMLQNGNLQSSTPIPYPVYDPYSASYYPTQHHPMTSSYTGPNQSINFDG